MQNVVLTVHLILALLLIGVVLLQRNEGGSLLSGGGAMTARGAANALTKLTWAFAVAFIATSITLTVLAARQSGGGSVIDGTAPADATTAPASNLPAPTGNLLPTLPSDAPAAPPPATTPATDSSAPASAPAAGTAPAAGADKPADKSTTP
jgi:preprotein translocase subunit SecG